VGSSLSCGNSFQCAVAGNSWWISAGYDVQVTFPSNCPEEIPGSYYHALFAGNAKAPLSDMNLGYTYDLVSVFDPYGNNVSNNVSQATFTNLNDGSGQAVASSIVDYYAATAMAPYPSTDFYDQAGLETFASLSGNQAIGSVTITYTLDANARIVGPTSANTGTSYVWTGSKSGTTDPQRFQWYRNDSLLTGVTTSTYSFAPGYPGPFTLKLRTTDQSTGKLDSVRFAATAVFSVSISGPTSVHLPSGTCTWSGTIIGGVSPRQYQWKRDGAVVSTGTSYNGTADASSHTLTVLVTDANHVQEGAGLSFSGTTSGGTACKQ
jgi:hypothetical protein